MQHAQHFNRKSTSKFHLESRETPSPQRNEEFYDCEVGDDQNSQEEIMDNKEQNIYQHEDYQANFVHESKKESENINDSPQRNDAISRGLVKKKVSQIKQRQKLYTAKQGPTTPKYSNKTATKKVVDKKLQLNLQALTQNSQQYDRKVARSSRQVYKQNEKSPGSADFRRVQQQFANRGDGDSDDQNSENLHEQTVSRDQRGLEALGEVKPTELIRRERIVHSPSEKFQSKQKNRPGNLPNKNHNSNHPPVLGSGRKQYQTKVHNTQQMTQLSYPQLILAQHQQPKRNTLQMKHRKQSGFETHRLPQDRQKLNARTFSSNHGQTKAQNFKRKSNLIKNDGSKRKAVQSLGKVKQDLNEYQFEQIELQNLQKVSQPVSRVSDLNLKNHNISSGSAEQENQQIESAPNRFTNNFISPIVSKRKNMDQFAAKGSNLMDFNRMKLAKGYSLEIEDPDLLHQVIRAPDSHSPLDVDQVDGQTSQFPNQLKLNPSKRKIGLNNEEVKKRVGRGQKQGNPKQGGGKNALNVQKAQSSDSIDPDFRNVDEQVQNMDEANAQEQNAQRVIRVSINEEDQYNQIKNQNLNLVGENKKIQGSQHQQFIQAGADSNYLQQQQMGKSPGNLDQNPSFNKGNTNQQQVTRRIPSKSVYLNYNSKPAQPNNNPENLKSAADLKLNLQIHSMDKNALRIPNPIETLGLSGNQAYLPIKCSVFDAIQQKVPEQIRKRDSLLDNFASHRNEDMFANDQFSQDKQFEIPRDRIDKLIEEIYTNIDTGFFSMFSTNKKETKVSTKDKGRQEHIRVDGQRFSDIVSQSMRGPVSQSDIFSYNTITTQRNLENFKEDYRQKKEKREQQPKPSDPLDTLWLMLDEQDDELIQAESCLLYQTNYFGGIAATDRKDKKQRRISQSQPGADASSYLSIFSRRGTLYDYAPEVHAQAQLIQQKLKQTNLTHYITCQYKLVAIRNFMRLKVQKQQWLEECKKYNLRNSIIPAIQEHVLIMQRIPSRRREMILNSALSNFNVFQIYCEACKYVQDWTQAIDFGPFEQELKADPEEGIECIGECKSDRVSTAEFFLHKRYQADQEVQGINTLFNPSNYMFSVDILGNLLSNMKLAFYEKPEEKNFISKMLQESAENDAREALVQAYLVVREIYDDILTPIRQRQIRDCQMLQQKDSDYADQIFQAANGNRNLSEIKCPFTNLSLLADSKDPRRHFYSNYCWHVLDISCFKMSESDYRAALIGLPTDVKNQGTTTQQLLADKIDMLKMQLKTSNNEFEFELVFYIQLLQSIQYNLNIFGQFNPILINEQEIIDKMKERKN